MFGIKCCGIDCGLIIYPDILLWHLFVCVASCKYWFIKDILEAIQYTSAVFDLYWFYTQYGVFFYIFSITLFYLYFIQATLLTRMIFLSVNSSKTLTDID